MNMTILIVDDNPAFRHICRAIMESQPDEVRIGEAENGQEAVERVRLDPPDLVLMDIRMPVMDGMAATRRITTEFPAVKVLMVSMFADRYAIAAGLDAGAAGYLTKDCVVEELIPAIHAITRDRTYVGSCHEIDLTV